VPEGDNIGVQVGDGLPQLGVVGLLDGQRLAEGRIFDWGTATAALAAW
jgi:hypothetical protein